MIVLHPNIHTLSAHRRTAADPWGTVEAIRVDARGVIKAAGGRAEVLGERARGEEVVEPEGAAILPGLIDSHAHLHGLGLRLSALTAPDDTSPKEWARRVAEAAAARPPGTFIEGRSWNQEVWPGGAFPTHHILTEAAPEHPVVLHRTDRHAVWANAAAMRAAGVDSATTDPEGGRVERLADGSPSGVFVDAATDYITDALPPLTFAEQRDVVRRSASAFLAAGVTCVHAAMVELENLSVYAEALESEGAPGLRVRGMAFARPEALARWASMNAPCAVAGARWSVDTLKCFADGALGSRGAWLRDPYEGYPDAYGLSVATPAQIEAVARIAAHRGWQMATHAIGDRAIAETLAAYRRAAPVDRIEALRWRIEHFQHPDLEDIDAAVAAGVALAMQPIHATRDMRFAERLLGQARCATAYPWASVRARGLRVGFGSDYPIETLDPFAGLHAAITRQDEHGAPSGGWFPEQRLDRREAIDAYTAGAAALIRRDEGRLGQLDAVADFICVDTDPTTATPDAIRTTNVLWTVVAGQTAHGGPG